MTLADEASNTIKILYQNKSNQLHLNINTIDMNIELDKNIYIYLLFEFINQINKMKILQLSVNLEFYKIQQYYVIEFKVHLKLNKYLINYLIDL